MFICTACKKPIANYLSMMEQLLIGQKCTTKYKTKTCFYSQSNKKIEATLLIHGGAGDIADASVCGKFIGMKLALREAKEHLWPSNGSDGNALNAVETAVRKMEEDANFNAGYGACLNLEGNVELEAGIMEGKELKAGCVALLHNILHPISVARCVMDKCRYTFLGGTAAQKFALEHGFKETRDGALVTKAAISTWEEFKDLQRKGLDTTYARTELHIPGDPGTVGAVAIDTKGNIAVATSTGGITGKLPGRIGDVPLLGCGTYADNLVGGVTTTGHGETIMTYTLARQILSKIQYANMTAQQATEEACKEMTERFTGTGGAITIDAKGQIGIFWTSTRMSWAYTKGKDIVYGINHNEEFKEEL